jgi:hypothetical protein
MATAEGLRNRSQRLDKIAGKLQGSRHHNACGATLPRPVRSIPDAVVYLRQLLDPAPKKDAPLNSLEALFESLETKS